MTAPEVLGEVRQAGITLAVDGGQLRITAPKGSLTPALRQALIARKAELLRILTAPPPDELGDPCPDCGSKEKWVWLDGRQLCRSCLIWDESPPADVGERRTGIDAGANPGLPGFDALHLRPYTQNSHNSQI
jgi:hypothetical protein